jgi:hypothetical protein
MHLATLGFLITSVTGNVPESDQNVPKNYPKLRPLFENF